MSNRRHSRIRGTTPEIEAAARHLRQHLTPAEDVLWQALKERQLGGFKFRCQYPIGQFIVDFYCAQCRLIVEVDGGIHDRQVDYDAARTEKLQAYGHRVIHFQNEMVIRNLSIVLDQILAELLSDRF